MSELSDLELRKAVAEKIGWTKVHYEHITNRDVPEEFELWGHMPDYDPACPLWSTVLPYELSTDACFQDVVPWAKERDWLLDLRDYILFWVATFNPRSPAKSPIAIESPFAQGEAAAEAICCAVLKLEAKSEA